MLSPRTHDQVDNARWDGVISSRNAAMNFIRSFTGDVSFQGMSRRFGDRAETVTHVPV